MGRKTKKEITARELLLGNSYEYLNKNFHKFDERKKFKMSLDLVKADITRNQKHDHSASESLLDAIKALHGARRT